VDIVYRCMRPGDRPRAVQNLLAVHRLLLIWDSFQAVRFVPGPGGATPPLDEAGCQELPGFLETLAGRGRSAVLITSRITEDWLGGIRRIAVGGLASRGPQGTRGNSWRPARRRRSGRDERGRFAGGRR
jgi:hypothetical protein